VTQHVISVPPKFPDGNKRLTAWKADKHLVRVEKEQRLHI